MLLCMSNMLVLGCKKNFSTEAVHTCCISQGHYFYNLYDFKYVIVGQTLPGKRKINLHLDVFSQYDLVHTCCVLKAEFTEHPRGEKHRRFKVGYRRCDAVRMCNQQGALCHLCCSPGRKEECERQSGNRQFFRSGTSPCTQT